MPEQIIIEFIVDNTQILSTAEILQKMGVLTDNELDIIKKLGAESAKAFSAANDAGKKMLPTFNQLEKNITDVGNAAIDTFQKEIPKAVLKSVADINKQQVKIPVTPTISPEDIRSIKTKINATDVVVPVTLSVTPADVNKIEAQLSGAEVKVPVTPVVNQATISQALNNIKTQLNATDINFDLLSGAAGQAEKLLPFIEKDSQAYKELVTNITQANAALDKILSQSQNINNLTGQLQAALKSKLGDIDFGNIDFSKLKDAKSTLDSVGDDARKLTAILKESSNALNTLDPNTNEFKTLNQLFESGTITIQQYNDALKTLSAAEESAGTRQATFRTQIRASTQALAEQFAAGQLTVSELYELAKGGAQLENSYENAAQAIRALSSNTFPFNAFTQGVQTATGAVQIFTGVQALAGDANKDFQQTLIKLTSLLNISAGLQQVVNNFQKQSALVLQGQILLEKTWNFIRTGNFQTTKQLIAATQQEIATKQADVAITEELTIAETAASVAGQVLRGVLVASGIGLLVIALGFLIGKLTETSSAEKDAADETKAFNDSIDEQNTLLDESATSLERQLEIIKARLKFQKDGQNEINAATLESLKLQKQQVDSDIAQNKAVRDNLAATLQEQLDFYKITEEEAKKSSDNDIKLLANEIDERDKANQQITDLQKKSADLDYQITLTTLNQKNDAHQKDLDNQKKAAEQAKQIAQANAQALIDIEQRKADHLKSLSENDNFGYGAQLKFLQQFVDQETSVLNLQRAKDIQQENLTALQKLNINQKYDDAISKLAHDGYTKRNALIKQANDDLKTQDAADFQSILNDEEKRIQTMLSNVDKDFEGINKNNTADKNAKLKTIADAYINGIIPTTEQYEAIRQKIITDSELTDLNNQKAKLDAKLSNLNISYKNREISDETYHKHLSDLENQSADVDQQIQNKKVEVHKNANEQIVANEQATAQKIQDALEFINQSVQQSFEQTGAVIFSAFVGLYEGLQKIKADDSLDAKGKELASFAAAAQAVQQTLNALFEEGFQQRQAQTQAEIDRLEKLRQAEIDNVNLTQSQKDAINKKFDRQEAAIKTRAAQAQKQADTSQAIINGALAVLETFAKVPWPLSIAVAGLIAGLTARQVSIIQSAPIPQFKKGTQNAPAGYALVGELGPEIVKLRGGEKIYTHTESRIIEKRWEKERLRENYKGPVIFEDYWLLNQQHSKLSPEIMPSPFDAIAGLIPQPVDKEIIEKSYKEKTLTAEIDYDKLGDKIGAYVAQHMGKVVRDLPQTGFNWDENGVREWIRKGNQTDIILNKKGRLTKGK